MTNNKNSNNSLYADVLKNGTQKGGSMHEPISINEKIKNMTKSIDFLNKKFINLTGNINELTKRIDDLEYRMDIIKDPEENEPIYFENFKITIPPHL